MSVLVIVGALWGDEAKGKLVDVLAGDADLNVRYCGGHNAGHTVAADGKTFKFHLIPSGILHENCTAVISGGMVVCPKTLLDELDNLHANAKTTGRLRISKSAHVLFPYHRLLDRLEEEYRGARRVGTTSRGVGPAYQDKVARFGIRMAEFVDPERFPERLRIALAMKNRTIQLYGEEPLEYEPLLDEYQEYAERVRPFVGEVEREVNEAVRAGKRILFEGAQGTMLDLDHGTYPFVTSTYPTAGGACLGTGLAPGQIDNVLGVCGAYATRVGSGPFPSELCGSLADRIREEGREFGTTTGRPRRCGWLDLVAVRHASRISGFTSLAVTRLDVLSGFDQVGLCAAYDIEGTRVDWVPTDMAELEKAEPLWETMPGWSGDLSLCRKEDELPAQATEFLRRIEAFTETPISIVSVGARREETIILRPDLLW
ncbi:MAG: adenylosuccinate synthase [Armatimonadetes bacterium]|nr:adenylosuccinate synthase [Armatimonadota bacterium]